MKVEITKDYKKLKTGAKLEVTDAYASMLIKKGVAKEVKPEKK